MTKPDFFWFAVGVACGGVCAAFGYLAGAGVLPIRLLHRLGLTDLTDDEVDRYVDLKNRR